MADLLLDVFLAPVLYLLSLLMMGIVGAMMMAGVDKLRLAYKRGRNRP